MHQEDRPVTCDSVWDLLSAYADNEATPDEAALVEQHVAVCSDCARDLLFMRQTASVLVDTPEVLPPPELRQAILAATIYRPTWRRRIQTALRPVLTSPVRMSALGLAGAAAAVFGLMLMSWQRPLPPAPVPPEVSSPVPRIARLEDRPKPASPAVIRPERAPINGAASPVLSRPQSSERLLARTSAPVSAVHVASRAKSAPRADRAKKETKRVASVSRGGRRADNGEVPRLRPGLSDPMSVEPSMTERAPEEMRAPERMMTADVMPLPPGRDEDELQPRAAVSDGIPIKLASTTRTMSAGPVSSLADLRRALRRDNEATFSNAALFSPGDRSGMMLAVIKTRF